MNLQSKSAGRKSGGKKAGNAAAEPTGGAQAPTPAPLGKVDLADIEKSSSALVAQARQLVIATDEESVAAQELHQAHTDEQKKIDARVNPIKDALNLAKSLLLDEYKRVWAPLDEAKRLIKRKIADYEAEKEKKAREEAEAQAKADREKAEAERKRDAEALEKLGLTDLAEAKRKEPVLETRPVAVSPGPSRARGFAIRKVWDFEIVDAAQIPRKYMMPNQTAIRQVVTALKADHGIKGIRAFQKQV